MIFMGWQSPQLGAAGWQSPYLGAGATEERVKTLGSSIALAGLLLVGGLIYFAAASGRETEERRKSRR